MKRIARMKAPRRRRPARAAAGRTADESKPGPQGSPGAAGEARGALRTPTRKGRAEPPLIRSEAKEMSDRAPGEGSRAPLETFIPKKSRKFAAPLNRVQERERLRAIKESPSYVRAYEDVAFLKTRELRPVR